MSSSQQFHPHGPGRRALDVLAFIIRFKQEQCGDSPTMAEIAAGLGLASKSTVSVHLAALERYGLIARPSARDARRIGIPGAVWVGPREELSHG